MVRWCARFTPPGIATLNEESDAGLFKLLGVGRDFWLMDAQTEFADSTATSTAFDAVYPFFYSYFLFIFWGGARGSQLHPPPRTRRVMLPTYLDSARVY